MRNVKYEITKDEYELAKETSPYKLISDDVKMGYGCYGATVSEKDGKYYLSYSTGDSCD